MLGDGLRYPNIGRVGEVLEVLEVLTAAEKHDGTPAQVSLAWVLSHDNAPLFRMPAVARS